MQVADHGSTLEQLQQQVASAEQQQLQERDAAMARYEELERALQAAEEHLHHDQLHATELQRRLDEASASTQASRSFR